MNMNGVGVNVVLKEENGSSVIIETFHNHSFLTIKGCVRMCVM